ncbi:MAG: formate--phosphoribosylaminoimidazolecarboxamide ligase family protein [Thermoproteota archaeon]|nr:formate--phosphoribosylaminoimidazolecarboxamide ligase family protein [Candidatus Brockarchaeota archaeon]MBO3840716.1 formate--phosphoribosylaminoimidazolecarboxamide ligase family protein [Candidatus Brockarchaeota archaeon]
MVIKREEIQDVVSKYDAGSVTIGVLGSHSAEEVGVSAKSFGFKTLVVCQKGREELYAKYNKHLFDHVILLEKFSDIVREDVQEEMRRLNTIFIPNRSFSVYVGYDNIENVFMVPMYGNRMMLRTEERSEERNQYWLLEKAGIKTPKKFNKPEEIDRLVIVKVQQKKKPLERAFFYASSPEEYYKSAEELLKKDVISEEGLKKARIEEYVLGQKFNANFQGWALKDVFGDFDLLGFDDRKQTNLHGLLSLPAKDQVSLNIPIKNEEVGHYGLTMRESLKPLVYKAAEKFRRVCEEEYPPGIIGLFALQGAIAYDTDDPEQKRLEFYVFDVSPRIPGCPCVGPTSPEMRRLALKYLSLLKRYGLERIETPMDLPMLEIKHATINNRLEEIVT